MRVKRRWKWADDDKEPKTLILLMRRREMTKLPNIKHRNWMIRKRGKSNNERRGEGRSEKEQKQEETKINEEKKSKNKEMRRRRRNRE
jgi:hypothetical protein